MASILAVEDDAISLKILGTLLLKRGHITHQAVSVEEGIKFLEQDSLIDLIVLDNKLKGEYGWEFLEHIRNDFLYKEIPVIVYTASSDRNSVMKYMHLGVQQILVKPYNANIVVGEIKKALAFDWRNRLVEPVEHICNRLQCTRQEYITALNEASFSILDDAVLMNHHTQDGNPEKCLAHLAAIKTLGQNLGVMFLEDNAMKIEDTLNDSNIEAAQHLIGRLSLVSVMMQKYTEELLEKN